MKALVTGASSGIGRDIARALARRGYDLILTARREERLRALAEELPGNVRVIPADLSKRKECFRLYEAVREENIDMLVNNAGRGLLGAFDETDLETELNLLDVNITAVHILTKLFLLDFKRRGSGQILNVASSAAFLPGPLLSSYYASKAYVLRLSQAVAEELRRAGSGVTISVLCPGPVRTEFDTVAQVYTSSPGLDSAEVAEYAVRETLKGKQIIIPGITVKVAHVFQRLIPDKILARICWYIQRRKQNRPDRT